MPEQQSVGQTSVHPIEGCAYAWRQSRALRFCGGDQLGVISVASFTADPSVVDRHLHHFEFRLVHALNLQKDAAGDWGWLDDLSALPARVPAAVQIVAEDLIAIHQAFSRYVGEAFTAGRLFAALNGGVYMPLATFLNGGTASQLRGLAWFSLSDVGNVGSFVSSDDGGGGATQDWSFGGSVPCRIDPINSRVGEASVGGRLDDRSTHLITVPAGTEVATNNRFAISGRGTFEVTAVHERTAEWTQRFEAVEVS